MCGRYRQARDPREVAEWMDRVVNPLPNIAPSWNIAPTQPALVLRRHPETGDRHLDVLRWGLVPRWSKDTKAAARAINARAETLSEKPSFRDAFARRRCLVPAEGFYEWRAEGAAKQPYSIAPADGGLIAFAGLWEAWRDPASSEVIRSFAIVTTAANDALRPYHARMPVMLERDAWPAWLGETAGDLAPLLTGAATPPLTIHPVSSRVGRVAENDPDLARPIAMPAA